MHLIASPTREIADKYIALQKLPKTQCEFLTSRWQVEDRDPDYIETHIVNGGPAKGPAIAALEFWRLVDDDSGWKRGSIR